MAGAERDAVGPARPLHLEAGGPQHLPVPRGVGQPPLALGAGTVQLGQRAPGMAPGQAQADLLGGEEPVSAHSTDRLQRADRVAQVQQQAPADDHVELAESFRREVVDVHLYLLHARAQRLSRQLEAFPLLPRDLGQALGTQRPLGRRPVPVGVVGDVGAYDLRRAAALELEGQEPVVGPDVQAALAPHVRPRHPLDHRAQVEHARRDRARKLDRVVPEKVRGKGRRERHGGAA